MQTGANLNPRSTDRPQTQGPLSNRHARRAKSGPTGIVTAGTGEPMTTNGNSGVVSQVVTQTNKVYLSRKIYQICGHGLNQQQTIPHGGILRNVDDVSAGDLIVQTTMLFTKHKQWINQTVNRTNARNTADQLIDDAAQ